MELKKQQRPQSHDVLLERALAGSTRCCLHRGRSRRVLSPRSWITLARVDQLRTGDVGCAAPDREPVVDPGRPWSGRASEVELDPLQWTLDRWTRQASR